MDRAFEHRMMYAPSEELIKEAAASGMNWVVVDSYGHKNLRRQGLEDVYVPFAKYPKLQKTQSTFNDYHINRLQQARKLLSLAKSLGLKAAIHGYEIALPMAVKAVYPEFLMPPVSDMIAQIYTFAPPPDDYRPMCLTNPELREMITNKIRELFEMFSDLDGYIYSNNETTGANFAHRCPFCQQIPYWRMSQYLLTPFERGWIRSMAIKNFLCGAGGTQESVETRKHKYLELHHAGKITGEQKRFWETMVAKYGWYDPATEIPGFVKALSGNKTAFIYKTTWADFSVRQPVNPWMGAYAPQHEIVEVSFEHCRYGPEFFLALCQQIPKFAREVSQRKLAGVCGVPFNWGSSMIVEPAYYADPATWKLNRLNLDLFAAVAKDPETDVHGFVLDWLGRRYGASVPEKLAVLLDEVEEVTAKGHNLNGVAPQDVYGVSDYKYLTLDYMKGVLYRYAFLWKDGADRIRRDPENLHAMFAENEQALGRIKEMIAEIECLKPDLSEKAYTEFKECFSQWFDLLCLTVASRHAAMLLWSLEEGKTKPSIEISHTLQALQERLCKLSATSDLVRTIVTRH